MKIAGGALVLLAIMACNGSDEGPHNLRVTQEGSSLQVTWDPVRGATHYRVYHDTQSGCLNDSNGQPTCDELDGNMIEPVS